ncbi:hypothetical protein [Amycolatopsis pigmentata]|uniref:Uncharacterized protein n=1 Tax=Amycolatopsis pigmentata TaxID=450801 RepID=A0ABW5G4H1_9PSEU
MTDEDVETRPTRTGPERTKFGRRWRGFTGSLAVGLVALAVVVLGAGLVSAAVGAPGPGVAPLCAHPLAAILALALQRQADRRGGRVAAAAGTGVVVSVVVVLVFFWWWP